MPHLFLLLTLSLVAGLTAGVLIDVPINLAGAVVMSAAWAAALLSYLRRLPRLQLAAVAVLVCGAGWVSGAHAVDAALHPPLRTLLEQRLGGFAIDGPESRAEDPIVIEGRLREDAAVTATGVVLRIAVARVWIGAAPETAEGGVSVGVGGAMHAERLPQWTAGRVVRAPALLRRPARYFNDGVPDQERALARRGVTLVGTIKSAALIEVVSHGRWWEEAAAAARARTRRAIARHVGPWSPQSAAIATAILIGDRAGLDVEIERRLQEAGTYHVIAISGGNIAILAGLLLGVLAVVGMRGTAAAAIAIVVLAAYAAIASGGASVARATLMAALYLAVRLIDQRTAAVNAIGLTAAVVLLLTPLAIADVGFWLTFGATIAIVVGTASLMESANVPAAASTRARAARTIAGVLLATCCVELVLAPVSAMVFQRITVAGLILNFAALPAMTVVQLGAMAVVALDVVESTWLAASMGYVVHAGSTALTESARLLDYAPWLTWRVPSPPVALMVAYYAMLLVAAVIAWRSASVVWRRAAYATTAALFLIIIVAPQARVRAFGDGRLHLTMVDVGQGDAMLVTFPNGRTLAIDTGGTSISGAFDIGDRVIGPALRARRLLSLDYLAVTHGDPDHIGGALSLVRDFAPREIWWGTPVANHAPTALLQAEAHRTRATWRTLQRGDRLEIGGVELRVHHPAPPDWERQKVRNDDSLVFELRFGNVSMLLTGDIGSAVEEELLSTLDLLPTVVLKVAHHGSGTSSTRPFIERVQPTVAVIGVGRGNNYGHPVPYVLGRLTDAGTEVFRTDQDGQIEVVTDGADVEVRTYTGREALSAPWDTKDTKDTKSTKEVINGGSHVEPR